LAATPGNPTDSTTDGKSSFATWLLTVYPDGTPMKETIQASTGASGKVWLNGSTGDDDWSDGGNASMSITMGSVNTNLRS